MGDRAFVSWLKDAFLSDRENESEIPQLKKLNPRVIPDAIIQRICTSFSSSEKQILEKWRKGNKARDIAIYLTRNLSKSRNKELVSFFGGISGAAITVRYNHVAREMKHDRELNHEAIKIKEQVLNNRNVTL